MTHKSNNDITSTLIIGGAKGSSLSETGFTQEKLVNEYGYKIEEAEKAQSFLHSVKFPNTNAIIPLFLYEAEQAETKVTYNSAGYVLYPSGGEVYKLTICQRYKCMRSKDGNGHPHRFMKKRRINWL
jgi:hypothetical protein